MNWHQALHSPMNNSILLKVSGIFWGMVFFLPVILIIIVNGPVRAGMESFNPTPEWLGWCSDFIWDYAEMGFELEFITPVMIPIIGFIHSIMIVLHRPIISLITIKSIIFMYEKIFQGDVVIPKHTEEFILGGAISYISGHISSGVYWNTDNAIASHVINFICGMIFRRMHDRMDRIIKGNKKHIPSNDIQKNVAKEINEIIFEIKNQIPDGEYLKLMNCTRELYNAC